MTSWKELKGLLVAVALLLFAATACSRAQQPPSGHVHGHVTDVLGAVIRGASVFVHKNSASEEPLKLLTRTDGSGDFDLALPEGGYDILVTSPGFAAAVKTLSVSVGKARQSEWQLQVLSCDFPGLNCDTFQ